MAVIVVCSSCQGTGKVNKIIFKLVKVKIKCPYCQGKGKRDISNKDPYGKSKSN